MEIRKVGVVGCGLMGSGIAQVCSQSGYQVVVSEINNELLNKGLASITGFLTKSVERGKITEQDKDTTLGRIKGTTDIGDFFDCELVIEAVAENMDLKKNVFASLDKICPQHAILASNTSALSIIEIATATSRMDKVLGLHFMNPVPIMKLLEVIQTIATSDETLETGKEFGKSLGKTVVVAKDTPGFIANRLSIAYTLNAIRMLESGVATREDIDTAVTSGLNYPMGPLALADFLGIDTLYYAACDMYDKFKEPQYAPPVLLQKMIAAGWYGRKAGRGFYEYK
jgi:3-hydroxybutyryl-CoA dehydrogenase